MLEISTEALAHMADLFSRSSEGEAIRIAVMGPAGLALILDQPQESDISFDRENIRVVIDRNLMQYCQSIHIGFQAGGGGCAHGEQGGYVIEAENPINI